MSKLKDVVPGKARVHKHGTYVYRVPSGKKCKRAKRVVPRQSLSLDDVMRRYVRGLPIDMKVHEAVYMNRGVDYERMSKLDFDEKAAIAAEQAAIQQRYKDEQAKLATEREEEAKQVREDELRNEGRAQGSRPEGGGRDHLDDTLPDDSARLSSSNKSRNRNPK